jgi:hypothetical protein
MVMILIAVFRVMIPHSNIDRYQCFEAMRYAYETVRKYADIFITNNSSKINVNYHIVKTYGEWKYSSLMLALDGGD